MLDHIAELEEIGVAPPPSVPTFYAAPPQLISQNSVMVTTEPGTSGEAEVGLIVDNGQILVTIASDHTDRAAERFDIALSKRVCHKVVSTSVWRLDDVDRPLGLAAPAELGGRRGRSLPGRHARGAAPAEGPARGHPVADDPRSLPAPVRHRADDRRPAGEPALRAQLTDPLTDARLLLDYRVEVRDFLGHEGGTDGAAAHDSGAPTR